MKSHFDLVPVVQPEQLATWVWQTDELLEVWLWREVELPIKTVRAHLYLTNTCIRGAGPETFILEAWINEQHLQVESPLGDWHINRPIMHVFDVGAWLHTGTNRIAVYSKRSGPLPPGVLLVLDLFDDQGNSRRVQTDPDWKVAAQAPLGWPSMDIDYGGETPLVVLGDALTGTPGPAKAHPGLTTDLPGLPELYPGRVPGSRENHLVNEWKIPKRIAGYHNGAGQVVNPQGLLMDKKNETTLIPARKNVNPPYIVLDLGEETAGSVHLVTGCGGCGKYHIQIGESYAEVLHAGVNNHTFVEFTQWIGAESEILCGMTGFRFIRVTLLEADAPVTLRMVRVRTMLLPLQQLGNFRCSDPLLEKIWSVGAHTVRLCMNTGLWDGIKRDRLPWGGDAHVEADVLYNAFDDASALHETLQALHDAGEWPRVIQGIPGYTAYWVLANELVYQREGNKEALAKLAPELQAVGDWFVTQLGERYLWEASEEELPLVDWAWLNHDDCIKGTHFQLVAALQATALLLETVGQFLVAAGYKEIVVKAQQVAKKTWLDPVSHLFSERQQINAWAILSGCVDQANSDTFRQDLLDPRERIITPFQNYYLLQALAQLGEYQGGLRIIREYWGGMLDAGATSFWEVFDQSWVTVPSGVADLPGDHGDTHSNLATDAYGGYRISLCHGWAAGPTAWLSNEIVGIKPGTPGFEEIIIAPQLGDLTWAEATVPTPAGLVVARHERTAWGWQTTIEAPPDRVIKLRIPGDLPVPVSNVSVNGCLASSVISFQGGCELLLQGQPTYVIELPPQITAAVLPETELAG